LAVSASQPAVLPSIELEALTAVNEMIDKMGSTGEFKAFNRAFMEVRKVDRAVRYFDYIHARKAAMLALARAKQASNSWHS
jgi:hypothetical protein